MSQPVVIINDITLSSHSVDHSRVKLSTGEMTETGDINDYINANFIPARDVLIFSFTFQSNSFLKSQTTSNIQFKYIITK